MPNYIPFPDRETFLGTNHTRRGGRFIDRFKAKIRFGDPRRNGCWIWTATKQTRGKSSYGLMYAQLPERKGGLRPNRIAYLIQHGTIPADEMVCHLCNNGLCVNPSHLALGSAKDNRRDRALSEAIERRARGGQWHVPIHEILWEGWEHEDYNEIARERLSEISQDAAYILEYGTEFVME